MKKINPEPPIKVKINFWNKIKLWFLVITSFILWITIIFAGVNLLSFYVHSVYVNGFFDKDTLKYAIYLIIGSYFFLILDKSKIYESLNIKKDLPFITIEQIRKRQGQEIGKN